MGRFIVAGMMVGAGQATCKTDPPATLEAFDDDAQHAVGAAQMRELVIGHWIANSDAVVLLGPPGVVPDTQCDSLARRPIDSSKGVG